MSRKRKKARHDDHHVERNEDDAAQPVESPESVESVEAADDPQATELGEESPARDDVAAQTELDSLRREAAEMRELAQRKQAEFENYRKRIERERADVARYASFDLVKEILPVLDNLERALQAAESSPEEQFRAGVDIIRKQFQEILNRQGLSEVESLGKPFDPHVHEAVSRVASDEAPEGTVVEVFQKGYRFKERLLRPAMVAVSVAPEDSEAESSGSEVSDASGASDASDASDERNESETVRRTD